MSITVVHSLNHNVYTLTYILMVNNTILQVWVWSGEVCQSALLKGEVQFWGDGEVSPVERVQLAEELGGLFLTGGTGVDKEEEKGGKEKWRSGELWFEIFTVFLT